MPAAFKISARVFEVERETRGERQTTAMRLRTPFLITLKRVVENGDAEFIARSAHYFWNEANFIVVGGGGDGAAVAIPPPLPAAPEEHCAIATAAGASPFQLLRQKPGFLESLRNVKLCESGTPKRRKLKRSEVLE